MSQPLTGVFSTRSPNRPNPIGLHRARIVAREGLRIEVDALEAIDGTPVVDSSRPSSHPDDALRGTPGDRDRYAAAKRQAASEANAAGEHVMQYNARKQQVTRNIYLRAFTAAGLLEA